LCFDLIKLIPYFYYTKHNDDDSPKDQVTFLFLEAQYKVFTTDPGWIRADIILK